MSRIRTGSLGLVIARLGLLRQASPDENGGTEFRGPLSQQPEPVLGLGSTHAGREMAVAVRRAASEPQPVEVPLIFRVQFTVSMKPFYAPVPRPGDASRGSAPDVPIREEDFARFAGCADPELVFVLDLVARRDNGELSR